jgi:tRNA 2-thiouridine synthesizing protein E
LEVPQVAIEIDGQTVEIDAEGYLIHPEDWNEQVADQLAREEEVELTELHWKVFKFMREFYADRRVIADVRFVIKYLADELGEDKKDARKRLFEMFPYGYVKQACKIAGMKRPRGWSTG